VIYVLKKMQKKKKKKKRCILLLYIKLLSNSHDLLKGYDSL
jgi:hypothetical protein